MNNITCKDVPLPLGKLDREKRNILLSLPFYDGVEGLKNLIETSDTGEISKQVPADFYPLIAQANNDLGMIIVTARVVGSIQMVHNVLSMVESRLLDILRYLEKQFGSLDELDIDVDTKDDESKEEIIQHIHLLIYNDNRISIGDNNRMKNVDITTCSERID